ncbi:hypothetical protein [Aneurinibacillus migulanus]|uniref:hypothetical protein n=1 Tax=Aneurinibacillus migulanus TaxID=47500 RepID=UPI00209E48AC|nr:hypothetical protein [Aneurinibacillus migulanus]MCP1359068.1 hypothetical protein [Aneurinibacillus migulanus]
MGNLVIKKVAYKGEKFLYSSPELKMGLQIIEASNGAGKTTFSSFICYGLGMYVKQFDFREKNVIHNEVYIDKNNCVILDVEISGYIYQLSRYFHTQSNTIFIKGEDGTEASYPIYRTNQENEIFSDWILSKLGIEVCDIYQGTKKFKINFADLFRLIHYDQDTSPSKIYKEHRTNNNFISDSTTVRKVIFELLIGHQFSDYYALIGELNKKERERDTHKATLASYIDMTHKMDQDISGINFDEIVSQLHEYNHQLGKLYFYRDSLKNKQFNSTDLDRRIRQFRSELMDIENKNTDLRLTKRSVSLELKDLLQLRDDIILEVIQIRKIILAHQELNLFSPNTCPCCLREIKRKEDHCICGLTIDESQYEKFFYSSKEYLEILKSKQKSVETIEIAIESCKEELTAIEEQIIHLELMKEKVLTHLYEIEKDIQINASDSELNEVNDKILEVKNFIQENEQKKTLYEKYAELEKNYSDAKVSYTDLSKRLKSMESDVQYLLESQLANFEQIYTQLLKEADSGVITAELDENYMPLVNGGVYRQASANVAKRFIYYLTLLKMSIEQKGIPFPRFLLVDTPENLGIDKENLDKCLSQVLNIKEQTKGYQIILTTGIKKYPEEFKRYVAETFTEDGKLLKKRNER